MFILHLKKLATTFTAYNTAPNVRDTALHYLRPVATEYILLIWIQLTTVYMYEVWGITWSVSISHRRRWSEAAPDCCMVWPAGARHRPCKWPATWTAVCLCENWWATLGTFGLIIWTAFLHVTVSVTWCDNLTITWRLHICCWTDSTVYRKNRC